MGNIKHLASMILDLANYELNILENFIIVANYIVILIKFLNILNLV